MAAVASSSLQAMPDQGISQAISLLPLRVFNNVEVVCSSVDARSFHPASVAGH